MSETYLESLVAEPSGAAAEGAVVGPERRALAAWRRGRAALGPASSLRAMLDTGAEPLVRVLGFEPPSAVVWRERTVAATLFGSQRAVALLVTPWGERFEPFWREAVTEAMQRAASWCLLFNGTHLRIADAGRLFTRRHAEFDLERITSDARSLRALWKTCACGAIAAPSSTGPLTPLHDLVEASDRHAAGVCRSLKDGVLEASTELLSALVVTTRRRDALEAAFEQALTIVYRVLFLLFAEARALLPVWHPIYRESYSLDALRSAVERPDGARGLWDALRAMTRLAHAGCDAGDLRVTAFNGRLFSPARTPLADRPGLDDEAARRALLALSTRGAPGGRGREPIAYRDLGVEQLGAVYETLLDYTPRPASPSAGTVLRGRARQVTLETGAGIRKATGTFYTPQPIADYVVRRTLGPLVRDASPDDILRLRIVDPAMGSGAFLVAACRYLATAYEAALRRDGHGHAGEIGERDRSQFRRVVAERCLYGVDLNPMAVQLARLSVWLTTLAADRPLSFLDHRLRVGDSLTGAWLSALGRRPERRPRGRGPDRGDAMLFEELREMRDALREAVPQRFSLETAPNDTIAQVRAKEAAFAAMTARSTPLGRWRQIADFWCAAWFAADQASVPAAAFHAVSDALSHGRGSLQADAVAGYLRAAQAIARAHRFFHWELECPEVFFDGDGARRPDGGFDAVLGNPPWDMMRADGATDDGGRKKTVRFTRDAGMYAAQSDGHANSYQLFVERAVALTRTGGRIGLVLPAGIATDRGSAPLRRLLLSRCDVDALVGFDNRRRVFPIHRSVRFLLLTAAAGQPTGSIACRFGVEDPSDLESAGEERGSDWFPIRLPPALVERLSGEELTIPWLRSPLDVTIAERAAALFAPLGNPRGWGVRFGRELNATDDRHAFRPPDERHALPIVEGKQIEPFGVDLRSCRFRIRAADAERLLRGDRHTKPRLAYRDVASPTNRLTVIAALLPAGCVSTHTLFCLRTPLPALAQHLLCGLLNSFVVNYLARLFVSTHVTTALVERLPVPTRTDAPDAAREITALARLLARRKEDDAYARLQARVAALYQLSEDEFAHVLSTFPLVSKAERDAALEQLVRRSW